MNAESPLQLHNVSVSYGSIEVFTDISLSISKGEFVAIVGPSGCGKTTLLGVMSGFLRPTRGSVTRTGKARMVYQQDGLLPWLTVRENITLGLRHITNESDRIQQLTAMLDLIRLSGFEDHYPHQLSGGMKQRVELARALVGGSDVLLLDEPFSSLDYLTRIRLRAELSRMLAELPRTVVLVTHDIEEATQLADRVIVLSERPSKITRELTINVPRPRELTHTEVVNAMRTVLAELGLESAAVAQS